MKHFTNSKIDELMNKANNEGHLSGLDFSVLIQNLLISESGYVITTGNYECVNAAVAISLMDRIRAHPHIWKKLFMIA